MKTCKLSILDKQDAILVDRFETSNQIPLQFKKQKNKQTNYKHWDIWLLDMYTTLYIKQN